jgi:S1-C subfamily serine protease
VPIVVDRNGASQTLLWTPDQAFVSGLGPMVVILPGPNTVEKLGLVLDPAAVEGALVRDVVADSPAQRAGIVRGDRIVGVNERRIVGPTDMENAIEELPPERAVQFSLARPTRRPVSASTQAVPATPLKPLPR